MKRVLFFIIIIISITILCSCSIKTEDVTKIGYRHVLISGMPEQTTEKDFIELLVNAINSGNKVNKEDANDLVNYDYAIFLYEDNGTTEYYFKFDLANKKVCYKDNRGKWYIINDEFSNKLFLNNNFDKIYLNSIPPSVSLYINDEKINTDIFYDWYYKKIDNQYYYRNFFYHLEDEVKTISNDDKLEFEFSNNKPDNIKINIYFEDKLIANLDSFENILDFIKEDGVHYLNIEATWEKNELKDFYGTLNLNYFVNIDKKADVKILSKNNFPGNILVFIVENLNNDESIIINNSIDSSQVEIFPYNNNYVGFMPINIWTNPGNYNIIANINNETDNSYVLNKKFEVLDKDFPTQYLTISEEISNNTRNDEAYAEFSKYAKTARSISLNKKLWQGKFMIPVEGVLTTDFGEIRYVNEELTYSRHSGLDIAAPEGTEIKSSNSGKVTLARKLILTGNTIIIDHGFGVFTTYYHLNTMNVTKGQMVDKGEIIGTVGSTGFSTGPHLHFSVSIYNSYVNTYQVLEEELEI